ncbi:phBC6A51 family helix-turn-helix protein [Niallia taxi]|uniref:phBC6A51 family helix-turn-helix protein n=1 Tax=Niallia taxi TaxID=2499688 RepID=UPI002E1FD1BB|nr:hypothetical protein [Niallia taxi]
MKEIEAPATLCEEQIRLAKAYVTERHQTGISVADFCSKQGISSATWYGDQYMKNPVFVSFLTALGGSIVSESEWETHEVIKRKVRSMAESAKGGVREIELYLKLFEHVVEADRQKNMKELGIIPAHEDQQQKTIEEKKAYLLKRLTTK